MYKHFQNYTRASIPNARRLRKDMTDAERRLWSRLRNNQLEIKFRRQVPFGKYVLDFYCARIKLCIELDGGQHYTTEGMEKDAKREETLRDGGVETIRFSDRDVLLNTDGVLQTIYEISQRRLDVETPPSKKMAGKP